MATKKETKKKIYLSAPITGRDRQECERYFAELEDWRIDKPGTAPEKYDQLQDRLDRRFKAKVMTMSEDGETARAIATYRRWEKHRSIGINDRRTRLYNADRVHYSKGAMQRRNHGH